MNQMAEPPVLQRRGSIHKCPSCGAALGAFASVCNACGHELLEVDANRSISALAERFEEIEREVESMGYKGKRREDFINEKKGRVIRDFPIPNSRDDLQQLMYYIQPKILPSVKPDPNVEEWRTKFTEVLNRAKQAYRNDDSVLSEIAKMEASIDSSLSQSLGIKAKRNPLFFALLGGVVLLGAAAFVNSRIEANKVAECEQAYVESAAAEKGRLEGLAATIEQDVQARRFSEAQSKLGRVRWELAPACQLDQNAAAQAGWQEHLQQLTAFVNTKAEQDAGARQAQLEREAAEQQAAANRVTAERVAQENKVVEVARIQADQKKAESARDAGDKRKAALENQW
ncbi:hypothetical protein [Massilia sp. 9I]|uniref:hypothetical protein n=1 Tax=Massilia sp. 9I TaxID=2653152 RepID=UPI0012F0CE28|nr:hypothetical protein [Massilia sp. 9I]VXC56926.1 hypothetical protein MASSI9I_80002 [Massilia sp. 9I]